MPNIECDGIAVVGSVDGRFRVLLRNDVNDKNGDAPWWRRGVLKYAGEDYAQDIRSLYGIEIETPGNDPRPWQSGGLPC